MPFLSYKVGMTMHIGSPQNNEYMKMDLEVKDWDTSVPFEDQIQQVHVESHKLREWANEQLGEMMLEALKKESA